MLRGIRRILEENAVDPAQVKGIGVAYQMHGLVVVDKKDTLKRGYYLV